MKNEFKFSTMRQFGSEQFSFTSTVHSDNLALSENEISEKVKEISTAVTKAFIEVQEREISEKDLLIGASERRTAAVKRLDEALKEEMKVKSEAKDTMVAAEKLSRKLTKN